MLSARYGTLQGIERAEYYEDGTLKSCALNQRNLLATACGAVVPQYGDEHVRRKYTQSLSFYPSGAVKSISLEEQNEVLTPMGEFPAELVTFYETGEVKRVFPLNGKISGYWSEKDEAQLALPFRFEFDFGSFCVKLIGLHFYKSGALKSLTLFPGEVITLTTPMGEIPVRTGFSLYESGNLKSIEPAEPVLLMTDLGPFTAFDPIRIGVHADDNSLAFYEDGRLFALSTVSDKIGITENSGKFHLFGPTERPDPLDDEKTTTLPLRIRFEDGRIVVEEERVQVFDSAAVRINVFPTLKQGLGCSPADCASCKASCKKDII